MSPSSSARIHLRCWLVVVRRGIFRLYCGRSIEAYRMFDTTARKTWSPPTSPLPKPRFNGQPDSPLCINADALQTVMGLPAGSKLTKPQHCGRKPDDWPLQRPLRRHHDSGIPTATDRLDGPIRNTGEKT